MGDSKYAVIEAPTDHGTIKSLLDACTADSVTYTGPLPLTTW